MTTVYRCWSGIAEPDNLDAYPAHFVKNVVPNLKEVEGFLGADLISRKRGNHMEYTVISRWKSMQAVEAFAGKNCSQAVIEQEAVAALTSFDETVFHYNVIASATIEQQ